MPDPLLLVWKILWFPLFAASIGGLWFAIAITHGPQTACRVIGSADVGFRLANGTAAPPLSGARMCDEDFDA